MNNNTIPQNMNRDDDGKFLTRYDEPKLLRSMKLTDTAWQVLKELGDEDCISRTDVIERFVRANNSSQKAILKALNTFIEDEQKDWQESNNPMQKGDFKFSRTWDKLLKFQELIKHAPWELLGEDS